MSYTIYVLKSKIAEKSYVGFTQDLENRLKEHNNGLNTYTKRYKPWEVIYTEEVNDYLKARKREKYLKSASGRRLVMKSIFNK